MWHIWLPGPWASHQSGLGLGCDHRSGSLHLPIWKSGIVLNILSECDTTYFVNYHLILVTGPSTDHHMKWRQKNYKVKIIKKLNPHQTTATWTLYLQCTQTPARTRLVNTTRTTNRLDQKTDSGDGESALDFPKFWPSPTNSAFICRYLFH